MLRTEEGKQLKIFCGRIEDLMPKEYFLRDLEKYVDFRFIYDKVKDLCSNKGSPSIDPIMIIKMLLIGAVDKREKSIKKAVQEKLNSEKFELDRINDTLL